MLKYCLIYTSIRMAKQTEFGIFKSNILGKLDLDLEIKKIVSQQFGLDDKHRTILFLLSKESTTEYQLGKLGGKFGLDRDSVRRRLLGTNSLVGLERNYFIISNEEDFKTGKQTKQYSLTLKGFVVSLSQTKFTNTNQIKSLRKKLVDFTGNELLSELIILYTTIHTALVLLWTGINYFELTPMFDYSSFFTNSYLKQILYDNPQYPFINDNASELLERLRRRLLATNYIIKQIIEKSVNDTSSKIYSNLKLSELTEKEEREDYAKQELVEYWYDFINSAMKEIEPKLGHNSYEKLRNSPNSSWQLSNDHIENLLEEVTKDSKLENKINIIPKNFFEI
jgi:hypothetical protein